MVELMASNLRNYTPKKGYYVDLDNNLYRVTKINKKAEIVKCKKLGPETFHEFRFSYLTNSLKSVFVGQDREVIELIYGK